jgi:hypothetical protein
MASFATNNNGDNYGGDNYSMMVVMNRDGGCES